MPVEPVEIHVTHHSLVHSLDITECFGGEHLIELRMGFQNTLRLYVYIDLFGAFLENMIITKTMREKAGIMPFIHNKTPRNRKHCTRVHP